MSNIIKILPFVGITIFCIPIILIFLIFNVLLTIPLIFYRLFKTVKILGESNLNKCYIRRLKDKIERNIIAYVMVLITFLFTIVIEFTKEVVLGSLGLILAKENVSSETLNFVKTILIVVFAFSFFLRETESRRYMFLILDKLYQSELVDFLQLVTMTRGCHPLTGKVFIASTNWNFDKKGSPLKDKTFLKSEKRGNLINLNINYIIKSNNIFLHRIFRVEKIFNLSLKNGNYRFKLLEKFYIFNFLFPLDIIRENKQFKCDDELKITKLRVILHKFKSGKLAISDKKSKNDSFFKNGFTHCLSFSEIVDNLIFKNMPLYDQNIYYRLYAGGPIYERTLGIFKNYKEIIVHNELYFGVFDLNPILLCLSKTKCFKYQNTKMKLYKTDLCGLALKDGYKIPRKPYKDRKSKAILILEKMTEDEVNEKFLEISKRIDYTKKYNETKNDNSKVVVNLIDPMKSKVLKEIKELETGFCIENENTIFEEIEKKNSKNLFDYRSALVSHNIFVDNNVIDLKGIFTNCMDEVIKNEKGNKSRFISSSMIEEKRASKGSRTRGEILTENMALRKKYSDEYDKTSIIEKTVNVEKIKEVKSRLKEITPVLKNYFEILIEYKDKELGIIEELNNKYTRGDDKKKSKDEIKKGKSRYKFLKTVEYSLKEQFRFKSKIRGLSKGKKSKNSNKNSNGSCNNKKICLKRSELMSSILYENGSIPKSGASYINSSKNLKFKQLGLTSSYLKKCKNEYKLFGRNLFWNTEIDEFLTSSIKKYFPLKEICDNMVSKHFGALDHALEETGLEISIFKTNFKDFLAGYSKLIKNSNK